MCWKKIVEWLNNSEPVEYETSNKVALLFAINNYPGSSNDLSGCLNDQDDLIKKIPDFQIRNFRDSEVTRSNFIAELDQAISTAVQGDILLVHYSGHGTQLQDKNGDEPDRIDEALYLYDGPLVDDDINISLSKLKDGVICVVLLDSCFSGTATKAVSNKNKFLPYKGKALKRINKGEKGELKWVVFSGCSEHQTSADAFISGKYNGAFTYFLLKTLDRKLTYKQWYEKITDYLPSGEFDQVPTLEGPEELLNKVLLT